MPGPEGGQQVSWRLDVWAAVSRLQRGGLVMPDEILGGYNLGSRRPPQVGTLIDPFKSTNVRARKPKEEAKAEELQRKWDHEDWVAWHYRDTRAESASKKRNDKQ